ncbi:uncharacterized protein TM35_000311680 [Trypanosoma theileri]|uniref:Trypanosoma glutamic acid/alanine-rich protein domain-containing protein n=1 Tax=Trypanosoma theileri TaxID=67003 RepID=A0A1X0NML6_9TRYP|nr:uncharacterized protein TM35_000311680 [Trypanosoma theileri]ORC85982.1 hypothetical protein TM35_000311680 [Trypanosoma theileri]
MTRKSMLSCCVLCPLAIVLCCVGVAYAAAQLEGWQKRDIDIVTSVAKNAYIWIVKADEAFAEIVKVTDECKSVARSTKTAARRAETFARSVERLLKRVESNPPKVTQKRAEGDEVIKEAKDAAVLARNTAKKTEEKADQTSLIGVTANSASQNLDRVYTWRLRKYNEIHQETAEKDFLRQMKESVESVYPNINESDLDTGGQDVIFASDTANYAAYNAEKSADSAEAAAKRVEEALEKLETAVHALKKKMEGRESTEKERSPEHSTTITAPPAAVGEKRVKQQENTGTGPETKQTTEVQEERTEAVNGQESGSANTPTKQLSRSPRGSNDGETSVNTLLQNAALTNGMALNDGSSTPALLRAPFLLLLLLLSVLGCMTVC